MFFFFFFFNDTATTEIYTTANTLSLHDALPIRQHAGQQGTDRRHPHEHHRVGRHDPARSEEHTSELQSLAVISYAVFCLKTKKELALLGAQAPNHLLNEREIGLLQPASLARELLFQYVAIALRCFFFFNDTATTEIYTTANTLSLHDALPI